MITQNFRFEFLFLPFGVNFVLVAKKHKRKGRYKHV